VPRRASELGPPSPAEETQVQDHRLESRSALQPFGQRRHPRGKPPPDWMHGCHLYPHSLHSTMTLASFTIVTFARRALRRRSSIGIPPFRSR
jgi:hypothetical protein